MSQPYFVTWDQEYVRKASAGEVILPINDDWLCAYAVYLGYTRAINDSWLQTICFHFGIMEPVNDSWYQALCEFYGFDTPVYNNSWRYTLAFIPWQNLISLTPWEEANVKWEDEDEWIII
jgi:hypothetical protein